MVVSLWLCGNHVFNKRLVRTCNSFSTPDGLSVAYKWPRILSELQNLENVNFAANTMNEPLFLVAGEIRRLPKSLKRLKISIPKSVCLLLSNLDASTPITQLIRPNSPISQLWNVTQYFPVLEELELDDTTKIVHFRLRGFDLTVFPSSLHLLHLRNISLPLAAFSHLPRQLQSLDICSTSHSPVDLQTLPPSLTHLGPGILLHNASELKAIPRSITSRVVGSARWMVTALRDLPPKLKSLCITSGDYQDIHGNWMSMLPHTLTELSVSLPLPSGSLSYPPRVTYLKVPISSTLLKRADEHHELWPSTLIILEHDFPQPYSIYPNELLLLPNTLTALRKVQVISDIGPGELFFSSLLPPALTELSIIYAIPWFLTTPTYKEVGIHDLDGYRKLYGLNDSRILIPRILSLSIAWEQKICTHFGCKAVCFLHTVSNLSFQKITAFELSHLPPGLKSLTIMEVACDLMEDSLTHLPPGLTHLKLSISSDKRLDLRAFLHLPPSLCSLHLPKITLNYLKYLPTSIKSLVASIVDIGSHRFVKSELPDRWLRWLHHRSFL